MKKLLADNEGITDYAAEESARENFSEVQEWGSGYRLCGEGDQPLRLNGIG